MPEEPQESAKVPEVLFACEDFVAPPVEDALITTFGICAWERSTPNTRHNRMGRYPRHLEILTAVLFRSIRFCDLVSGETGPGSGLVKP
jgi:hypothetical protein